MSIATKYRAGDVLSEQEVARRINKAVESLQDDVADTIRLHNLVCNGEITVYEDERGPLDAGGEPIKDAESEPWIYTFTRGEDDDGDDVVSDQELTMLVSDMVREASPLTVKRAIRELAKSRGLL